MAAQNLCFTPECTRFKSHFDTLSKLRISYFRSIDEIIEMHDGLGGRQVSQRSAIRNSSGKLTTIKNRQPLGWSLCSLSVSNT